MSFDYDTDRYDVGGSSTTPTRKLPPPNLLDYDTGSYDAGGFSTTQPRVLPASYLISAPEIRICDENYIPRIVLDGYKNLTYTERHRNRDSWSFEVSRHSVYAQYLIKGRIIHHVTGSSVYALIIKQIDATRDTITVSGNDYADDLLSARIALVNVLNGTGADEIQDTAETAFRHYVNGNIIEATDTYRRDPFLTLEPVDYGRGETVTISARFENLLDLCETIGSLGGIGWRSVVVDDETKPWGWRIVMSVVEGNDLGEVI